jgi:hypothetical protein
VAYRVAVKAKALAGRRQTHEKPSPETVLEDNAQAGSADEATQDLRQVLDEELQRLPEKYRAAVVLCYFEGKTIDEAAHLLGCRASAAKLRLFRARALLKNRLERRCVALSAAALTALLAQEGMAMALPHSLVAPVVEGAMAPGAGQTGAGAISPVAGRLAEAVLREMARGRGLRWAFLAALALLGAAGIGMALHAWSAPKIAEKIEQPSPNAASNERVFDSSLPLLVLEQVQMSGRARWLGVTPTSNGQGIRIPAGHRWVVMPLSQQGKVVSPVYEGSKVGRFATPHMTRDQLRAFVNEMRRREVPGVYIADPEFTDDDLAQFAGLPCLETLSVAGPISDRGLERLGDLPRLGFLDVQSDKVTGAGVARFSQVEWLRVASGGMSDKLADHLKGMSHLKCLRLSGCMFGDAGWEKLAEVTALQQGLESLCISYGSIGPKGMGALRSLKELKQLELYHVQISDEVLQAAGRMAQLHTLVIDCCGDHSLRCYPGNSAVVELVNVHSDRIVPLQLDRPQQIRFEPIGRVTDRGLGHLSGLSQLQQLELGSDEITDEGVQALGSLGNLRHLRLHGRRLTDACLRHVASLRELRSLDLIGMRAGAAAAGQLRGLPRLQILLVPWNSSAAERAAFQQALPGVTVLGQPYRDWYELIERTQ